MVCRAFGVEFNLAKAPSFVMEVKNTEKRKQELVQQIQNFLTEKWLTRREALSLRGRLGFADSFIHGRLGVLAPKKLTTDAYCNTATLSRNLCGALHCMVSRQPCLITATRRKQCTVLVYRCFLWTQTGGLGEALVSEDGAVVAWFGFAVRIKHDNACVETACCSCWHFTLVLCYSLRFACVVVVRGQCECKWKRSSGHPCVSFGV